MYDILVFPLLREDVRRPSAPPKYLSADVCIVMELADFAMEAPMRRYVCDLANFRHFSRRCEGSVGGAAFWARASVINASGGRPMAQEFQEGKTYQRTSKSLSHEAA